MSKSIKKFGQIIVGNKRKGAVIYKSPPYLIFDADRSSVLGNPIVLEDHNNDQARAAVISQYKEILEKDWQNQGPIYKKCIEIARKVYQGYDVVLMCWCAGKPTFKPCHAELIKAKIENFLEGYK